MNESTYLGKIKEMSFKGQTISWRKSINSLNEATQNKNNIFPFPRDKVCGI